MFLFYNWVRSSTELNNPGQQYAQVQQWSFSVSYVKGVHSGRDTRRKKELLMDYFIESFSGVD